MPRSARLYFPGGIFHLISRFYNRKPLMSGAAERLHYLQLHEKATNRSDATVLAWCLMSSHIHLVVKAGEAPLSVLMKAVNTGFANWLNRRKGRLGAVFADRYKAILVEDERYLLELVRYVHNNPVRAGVVATPEESTWSSHGAYMGLEAAPDWLDTGIVLGRFSASLGHARRMFNNYVLDGVGEECRGDLSNHGRQRSAEKLTRLVGDGLRLSDAIVGSNQFATRVLEQMATEDVPVPAVRALDHTELVARRPPLSEIIAATCAVVGLEPWVFEQRPKAQLSARARRIIAWLWVQRYGGRQVDLARHLKVAVSLVSRWHGRAVSALPDLEVEMDQIETLVPAPMPSGERSPRSNIRYSVMVYDGTW